jgi:hypothetical protein
MTRTTHLKRANGSRPQVVITLENGLITAVTDGDVGVLILDYDVDGVGDDETRPDEDGTRCVVKSDTTADPASVERIFSHFRTI